MKRKWLNVLFIVILALFCESECMARTIALYLFDEEPGSGPRILADSSGNGNELTLTAPGSVIAGGKYGNYLGLGNILVDGDRAYIDDVRGTGLELGSDDWTLECWVRQSGSHLADSSHSIFGLLDTVSPFPTEGKLWEFWFAVPESASGSFYRAVLWGPWNFSANQWKNIAVDRTPFGYSEWYHMALVNHSGMIELYLNGVAQNNPPSTGYRDDINPAEAISDTHPIKFTVGTSGLGAHVFGGGIDELRISDTARYTGNFIPPASFANYQPSPERGFKLLFMDDEDIEDPWGRPVFISNPLQPIADVNNFGMENLVNAKQPDGSWIAYGMNWVGGEIPRRPRPGYEYLQVKAKTTDGFNFTNRVERPWDGNGPGTAMFLQKAMAYNAAIGQWLLLYGQYISPQEDGYPLRAYLSNDGLKFVEVPGSPVYNQHDALSAMWDPLTEEYYCYQVTFQPWPKKYPDNAQQGRRVVVIKHSPDGIHWEPPWNNTLPSTIPDNYTDYVIVPDENDPEDLEFYWFTTFVYADRYIGIMLLYEPGPPEVNPRNPGIPNSHGPYLASEWWISRDGIHWNRPYQHQYLGLEPDSQLGVYANLKAGLLQCNPIVIDGEILFIRRGKIPEDRIAGLAGAANTEFSSKPFRMPQSPLYLNATARWVNDKEQFQDKQAYIMVELLNSQGQAISGYEKEKCYFQDVDAPDLPLLWNGADGTSFKGQEVQLRFYIRSARIYAVTSPNVAPSTVSSWGVY